MFVVVGPNQWGTSNWIHFRKAVGGRAVQAVVVRDVGRRAGSRVDVVLRPTAAAAAKTVDVTRMLDHDFVFHDVPVVPQ